VPSLENTDRDRKDLERERKKNTQGLKKNISRAVDVLDEEEKIERIRLAKVNKIIKKNEGSDSEKLQKLLSERKMIFENLDEIMTTRERYLMIAQDMNNTE
jgi:DNA transposition AAA+ family ATPase